MSYNPRVNEFLSSPNARNICDVFENNSGSSFIKGRPVRIDTSSSIQAVDVSIEAEAKPFGILAENIANGTTGNIVTFGRIYDISTSMVVGDEVWLSKSGGLTAIPPEIGVSGWIVGDFAVKLGFIVKNNDDGNKKDIIVDIDLAGQL